MPLLFLLLLLSPSGIPVHIPHPRYVEEHFQFPLLQRALIDLSTDKFYLIQEPGMFIREVTVFQNIRP